MNEKRATTREEIIADIMANTSTEFSNSKGEVTHTTHGSSREFAALVADSVLRLRNDVDPDEPVQ